MQSRQKSEGAVASLISIYGSYAPVMVKQMLTLSITPNTSVLSCQLATGIIINDVVIHPQREQITSISSSVVCN